MQLKKNDQKGDKEKIFIPSRKNKKDAPEKVHCCRCNQEIIGDHVYIITRRKTRMHLCSKCFKEGL